MYWLFLLLAIVALTIALGATQAWLLVLALLATLGFFVLWLRGLYAARIGNTLGQTPRPLHPAELQALREQLRPAGDEAATPGAPASPVPPASTASTPSVPPTRQPEWP